MLSQKENQVNLFGSLCNIGITEFKSILDRLSSQYFNFCFNSLFIVLQRGKHLKQFEFFEKKYLCAIDGTNIFTSSKIHCDHCLKRGNNYHHQVLQGYLCHPLIR